MVLYFRLLLTLLQAWFQPAPEVGSSTHVWFRVMPWDTEFSALNAGRFFSFAEAAQLAQNLRTGFLGQALKRRWWATVRANYLAYSGNVRRFDRFKVCVRLLGCDERHFYWESRFYKASGELFALGYSKGVVRSRQAVVSPREALGAIGHLSDFGAVPEEVVRRLATPTELLKDAPRLVAVPFERKRA